MDIDPLPAMPVFYMPFRLLNLILMQADPAISFHAPVSWVGWSFMILVVLFCLLASAFVSGSEIAYFGLTPQDVEELEESEGKKDRKAFNLINHSERLLATVLITNTLVNITMVVVLTFAINQTVTFHSTVINFLVQTVFMTFLLLLFGEIFPKLVARSHTMKWVRVTVPAVSVLYSVLGPIARVM